MAKRTRSLGQRAGVSFEFEDVTAEDIEPPSAWIARARDEDVKLHASGFDVGQLGLSVPVRPVDADAFGDVVTLGTWLAAWSMDRLKGTTPGVDLAEERLELLRGLLEGPAFTWATSQLGREQRKHLRDALAEFVRVVCAPVPTPDLDDPRTIRDARAWWSAATDRVRLALEDFRVALEPLRATSLPTRVDRSTEADEDPDERAPSEVTCRVHVLENGVLAIDANPLTTPATGHPPMHAEGATKPHELARVLIDLRDRHAALLTPPMARKLNSCLTRARAPFRVKVEGKGERTKYRVHVVPTNRRGPPVRLVP